MSRDVTFSFAAECLGKKAYFTKREAKRKARWAESYLGAGHLLPYRCSWSSADEPHWHLGHPPHPNAIAVALQQLAKRQRRSEFSSGETR